MRMKKIVENRTLKSAAAEFLAFKRAQKIRERTLSDYKKYIDKFLVQSENTLDVEALKIEILDFFADIPKTSPARCNHPYIKNLLTSKFDFSCNMAAPKRVPLIISFLYLGLQ